MSDSNFNFFKKSELNLDMAEVQISFNDLLILKGISKKYTKMNENFEQYMKDLGANEMQQERNHDQFVKSDEMPQEGVTNGKGKNIR